MKKIIPRLSTTCLAFLFFVSNVMLAHAMETNLWKERTESRKNTQLAMLPHPVSPDQVIPTQAGLQNMLTPSPHAFMGASPKQIPGLKHIRNNEQRSKITGLIHALPAKHASVRGITRPEIAPKQEIRNAEGRIVIHVQDVHQNREAQKNIGRAIQALIDHNKIDLVGLEGAFEEINIDPIRTFPDKRVPQAVADYLLKENKISGAVHTAFTSPASIPAYVGVDDRDHYEANADAYRAGATIQDTRTKEIQNLKFKLQGEKERLFNKELLEFDRTVQDYRDEKLKLGAFAEYLVDRAGKRSTRPDAGRSLPAPSGRGDDVAENDGAFRFHVTLFLEALNLEESLDFTEVENQRTRLVHVLLESLDEPQMKKLLSAGVAFRLGHLKHADFYHFIKTLCEKNKVSLARYPAMRDYLQYVLLADSIDGEKLFNEISRMEEDAYDALVKTDEERDLVKESKKLYLAGKLVTFALTPEEWNAYKNDFLNPAPHASGRGLQSFEAFYKEAEARDRAMAENLLSAMQKESAQVAVLVTGGFHAKGMNALLNKAGVTTINVAPTITTIDSTGSDYLSVFTQEKTPLDRIFEGEKLYLTQKVMVARAAAAKLAIVTAGAFARAGNSIRKFEREVWRVALSPDNRIAAVSVTILAANAGVAGFLYSLNGEIARNNILGMMVFNLIFAAILYRRSIAGFFEFLIRPVPHAVTAGGVIDVRNAFMTGQGSNGGSRSQISDYIEQISDRAVQTPPATPLLSPLLFIAVVFLTGAVPKGLLSGEAAQGIVSWLANLFGSGRPVFPAGSTGLNGFTNGTAFDAIIVLPVLIAVTVVSILIYNKVFQINNSRGFRLFLDRLTKIVFVGSMNAFALFFLALYFQFPFTDRLIQFLIIGLVLAVLLFFPGFWNGGQKKRRGRGPIWAVVLALGLTGSAPEAAQSGIKMNAQPAAHSTQPASERHQTPDGYMNETFRLYEAAAQIQSGGRVVSPDTNNSPAVGREGTGETATGLEPLLKKVDPYTQARPPVDWKNFFSPRQKDLIETVLDPAQAIGIRAEAVRNLKEKFPGIHIPSDLLLRFLDPEMPVAVRVEAMGFLNLTHFMELESKPDLRGRMERNLEAFVYAYPPEGPRNEIERARRFLNQMGAHGKRMQEPRRPPPGTDWGKVIRIVFEALLVLTGVFIVIKAARYIIRNNQASLILAALLVPTALSGVTFGQGPDDPAPAAANAESTMNLGASFQEGVVTFLVLAAVAVAADFLIRRMTKQWKYRKIWLTLLRAVIFLPAAFFTGLILGHYYQFSKENMLPAGFLILLIYVLYSISDFLSDPNPPKGKKGLWIGFLTPVLFLVGLSGADGNASAQSALAQPTPPAVEAATPFLAGAFPMASLSIGNIQLIIALAVNLALIGILVYSQNKLFFNRRANENISMAATVILAMITSNIFSLSPPQSIAVLVLLLIAAIQGIIILARFRTEKDGSGFNRKTLSQSPVVSTFIFFLIGAVIYFFTALDRFSASRPAENNPSYHSPQIPPLSEREKVIKEQIDQLIHQAHTLSLSGRREQADRVYRQAEYLLPALPNDPFSYKETSGPKHIHHKEGHRGAAQGRINHSKREAMLLKLKIEGLKAILDEKGFEEVKQIHELLREANQAAADQNFEQRDRAFNEAETKANNLPDTTTRYQNEIEDIEVNPREILTRLIEAIKSGQQSKRGALSDDELTKLGVITTAPPSIEDLYNQLDPAFHSEEQRIQAARQLADTDVDDIHWPDLYRGRGNFRTALEDRLDLTGSDAARDQFQKVKNVLAKLDGYNNNVDAVRQLVIGENFEQAWTQALAIPSLGFRLEALLIVLREENTIQLSRVHANIREYNLDRALEAALQINNFGSREYTVGIILQLAHDLTKAGKFDQASKAFALAKTIPAPENTTESRDAKFRRIAERQALAGQYDSRFFEAAEHTVTNDMEDIKAQREALQYIESQRAQSGLPHNISPRDRKKINQNAPQPGFQGQAPVELNKSNRKINTRRTSRMAASISKRNSRNRPVSNRTRRAFTFLSILAPLSISFLGTYAVARQFTGEGFFAHAPMPIWNAEWMQILLVGAAFVPLLIFMAPLFAWAAKLLLAAIKSILASPVTRPLRVLVLLLAPGFALSLASDARGEISRDLSGGPRPVIGGAADAAVLNRSRIFENQPRDSQADPARKNQSPETSQNTPLQAEEAFSVDIQADADVITAFILAYTGGDQPSRDQIHSLLGGRTTNLNIRSILTAEAEGVRIDQYTDAQYRALFDHVRTNLRVLKIKGALSEDQAREIAEILVGVTVNANLPGLDIMYPFTGGTPEQIGEVLANLIEFSGNNDEFNSQRIITILAPHDWADHIQAEANRRYPGQHIVVLSKPGINTLITGSTLLVREAVEPILSANPERKKLASQSLFAFPDNVRPSVVKGTVLATMALLGFFLSGLMTTMRIFTQRTYSLADLVKNSLLTLYNA